MDAWSGRVALPTRADRPIATGRSGTGLRRGRDPPSELPTRALTSDRLRTATGRRIGCPPAHHDQTSHASLLRLPPLGGGRQSRGGRHLHAARGVARLRRLAARLLLGLCRLRLLRAMARLLVLRRPGPSRHPGSGGGARPARARGDHGLGARGRGSGGGGRRHLALRRRAGPGGRGPAAVRDGRGSRTHAARSRPRLGDVRRARRPDSRARHGRAALGWRCARPRGSAFDGEHRRGPAEPRPSRPEARRADGPRDAQAVPALRLAAGPRLRRHGPRPEHRPAGARPFRRHRAPRPLRRDLGFPEAGVRGRVRIDHARGRLGRQGCRDPRRPRDRAPPARGQFPRPRRHGGVRHGVHPHLLGGFHRRDLRAGLPPDRATP